MGLPTSGQLSFNDINVELGNVSGSEANMNTMTSQAGLSAPDEVADFYGYAWAEVTLTMGGLPTYITNETDAKDAYKSITITGMDVDSVLTVNITTSLTYSGGFGSTYTGRIYARVNSGPWGLIRLYSEVTGPGTNADTIPGLTNGDTLEVRVMTDIQNLFDSGQTTCGLTLTGGSFTNYGGGTITVSGFPLFQLTVNSV